MTLFFLAMLGIAMLVLTFLAAACLSAWSYVVTIEEQPDRERQS